MRRALYSLAIGLFACGGDSSGPPKAGPPATLTVVAGGAQEGQSGETLSSPLIVKVADAKGIPVPKAIVTFNVTSGGGTLSQRQDTTDTEGAASTTWTMGNSLGDARVEARVTGLVVPAIFNATVKAGPPALLARSSDAIGSSAAGFDVTDSVAIKVTDRFGHAVAGASVSFAVTAGGGAVSHATKTTGDDGIARTAWRLGAAGAQTLRATAGSLNVEVTGSAVSCDERTIGVGEVVSISPTANTCVVTNGSGAQKYLIAVANTSSSASSFTSFRLRGAGGAVSGNETTTPITSTPLSARTTFGLSAALAQQAEESERAVEAHAELMRANAQLMDRLGSNRRRDTRVTSTNLVQARVIPNVGDMVSVKIPRDFTNLCSVSASAQIRARVAYVGTRAIILEDSASAAIGQMDAKFREVGQEFDNVMYPILTTNFGSPIAFDTATDNDGRIYMVFSPVVNALQNIAGFVSSGDFFTPAQGCAASNVGEYFYARAPTTSTGGIDNNASTLTVDEWHRVIRTAIIHEVKHIASFAEKFASPNLIASGFFQRDQWLEEATAMMAEELWARGIFGYARAGNVNYAQSIYCEVRPTPNASWPQCQPAKPISMFDHFIFLYDYVSDPERRSAIGSPTAGDATFYGSGWLFLRWAIDTYAPEGEPEFLRAITRETDAAGTDGMVKFTSKPLDDLLSDFTLAVALDDYPNFTARDAKHTIVSWNTRNIFAGMSADFSSQNFFTNPTPLKVWPSTFGRFAVDIPSVTGGGFAVFEVAGTTSNKQLLEFRGTAGTGFPSELRVKVVRIQ